MRFVLSAFLLLVATAGAEPSRQRAKALYQQATAHFAIGDFVHAAEEYEEAYTLKQDPALLYNAAQSRRLAGQNEKALVLYRNYVQLYPREQSVAAAREQVDKLKEAIAAAEKAKSGPPTSTDEPKAVDVKPSEPAAQPEPAAEPQAQAAPVEHKTPVYKKWWLWTIVGVVVAGGVVTAAVLATRPSGSWANEPTVGPGAPAAALVRW